MAPPSEPPSGAETERARVLGDARAAAGGAGESGGVVWKLSEPGRQLDANVVRLAPGARVAPHVESDLDVLVLVLGGSGELAGGDAPEPLAEGSLAWLPHGARRSLTAGGAGLTYLTVHRRRPGMTIGHRPPG
ncbi:cupin domain-containing protein [Streptomyces sp. NPDC021020]|uniref:cupin domain-containing protein n=1 Tax=Streptomyces sp. NPDC021020 TaxID=3365109 RepID=UPI0037898A80